MIGMEEWVTTKIRRRRRLGTSNGWGTAKLGEPRSTGWDGRFGDRKDWGTRRSRGTRKI